MKRRQSRCHVVECERRGGGVVLLLLLHLAPFRFVAPVLKPNFHLHNISLHSIFANFGGPEVREFIHESQKQGHFRKERKKTNNLHIFAEFPNNYLGRHFG